MSVSSSRHHEQGEHVPPVTVQITNSDHKQQDIDADESDQMFAIKVFLNNELMRLNSDQMLQIMEIIKVHTDNTSQKVTNNTDVTNEDGIQFEYVLDVNDTVLHSIFAESTAQQIKQIVNHKLTLIFIVITGIVVFPVEMIFGFGKLIHNIYMYIMYCLIAIPWLIFQHLVLNKFAFKLCIKTFDYWIKVGYALMWSGANLCVWGPFSPVYGHNGFTLTNILEFIVVVFTVMSVSYVSSFDAVHSSKTSKLILSIFVALLFSYWSVASQFLWPDESSLKITVQLSAEERVISMLSLISSSSRIIAIFMWKQSHKTWKSKGRAITILEAPKLRWIDSTTKPETNKSTYSTNIATEMDAFEKRQKVPEVVVKSNLHQHNCANRDESISISVNRSS
eukprot:490368_1